MGGYAHCLVTKIYALLFSFSMFILLGSTLRKNSVECRRVLVEVSELSAKGGEGEKMMMEGAMIGSRPPNCLGMCISCDHCEAVQVPLTPLEKEGRMVKYHSITFSSRGDEYSSNYKPMNWKCKCGDIVINP